MKSDITKELERQRADAIGKLIACAIACVIVIAVGIYFLLTTL